MGGYDLAKSGFIDSVLNGTYDGAFVLRGYGPIFSGGATSLEQAQPVSLAAPQRITIDLAMPKGQGQSPGWYVHLPLIQR